MLKLVELVIDFVQPFQRPMKIGVIHLGRPTVELPAALFGLAARPLEPRQDNTALFTQTISPDIDRRPPDYSPSAHKTSMKTSMYVSS